MGADQDVVELEQRFVLGCRLNDEGIDAGAGDRARPQRLAKRRFVGDTAARSVDDDGALPRRTARSGSTAAAALPLPSYPLTSPISSGTPSQPAEYQAFGRFSKRRIGLIVTARNR